MSNINKVFLTGRISQDVEINYFESGTSKTSFSVAVGKYVKKENKEIPNFFNVEIWGKQGEFVAQYGKKGQQISLEGSLDVSSWEDKDGNKKSRVFINAHNVELGSMPKGSTQKTNEPEFSDDVIGEEEIPF